MSAEETAFLQRHLAGAHRYLEFGSGTSTALAVGIPQIELIDSVESSKAFIDGPLLRLPGIQEAVDQGRLHVHWIDIGPTGAWGGPVDRSASARWPDYSSFIFREDSGWDLVLVDGRFRVACALAALLHTKPETTVLIHDFWCRPEYAIVLRFFDVVDRVDSFVSLRRREKVDLTKAKKVYAAYSKLPFDETFSRRVRNFIKRRLPG